LRVDVGINVAGLDVSTDPLPLPWHRIDPYINSKYCISPINLHPTLISLLVWGLRPNCDVSPGLFDWFRLGL
jgi:hypothetical protein